MEIISRAEAKGLGVKRFYTGVVCRHGHDSERYTKGGNCVECSELTDLLRRHDNPEAIRKSLEVEQNRQTNAEARRVAKRTGQEYYSTGIPCKRGHICDRNTKTGCCIECAKLQSRKWAMANKAKAYASSANWRKNHLPQTADRQARIREKNPVRNRVYQLISNKNRREKYANDPALRERIYKWRRENPEKVASHKKRHRLNKMNAEGTHTTEDWLWLCAKFDNRCLKCGNKTKMTEDHIIAPDLGGSDYIENIQPLCGSCNSSKGQKIISYIPADTFLLYPSMREAM